MDAIKACQKAGLAKLVRQYGSVAALAKAVDIDRSYLSRLVSGTQPLTAKQRIRIEESLGLEPEFLLSQDSLADVGRHTAISLETMIRLGEEWETMLLAEGLDPRKISLPRALELIADEYIARETAKIERHRAFDAEEAG